MLSMTDPDSFVDTIYISKVQFMEQSRDSDIPAKHNAIPGKSSNPLAMAKYEEKASKSRLGLLGVRRLQ